MVKNLLLIFFATIMSASIVTAQESLNCEDSEMSALCDINDIDGATFTNPDPANSDVPSGSLCTDGGVFNNPGWFSFVAGSVDIDLIVTPLPMTCDTTMGGQTGIQVALWQGCPNAGGECVAGDADCNDTPITLNATDLIVGEIYNLTIDGCAGSICTVEVDISSATQFALPDLSTVDLAEPEYNFRMSCDNSLGEGNFCANLPVNFAVDDEFYETLGAEYSWTVTGPNIADIEWEFGNFSGTGPDFIVGDLNGELGGNGINMMFPEPGTYTICLDNASTECDRDADGEACTTITIIQPGEQDFGVVEVCALDLLAGWEPDFEDENGNAWLAGSISLDQVENATDGIVSIVTQDDCGCDFEQIIQVIVSGSIEREEVELFIWECMLPYTWFEEEFVDLSDLPIGGDFNIREGSAQSDYEGNACDSLVSLTITPLTIIDTVIIGNCTSMGTEFTFQFSALDPDGNDVTISNPSVEWIDATNNTIVSTNFTALLASGSYFVNFLGSLEDLNYMDDGLAGIEVDAECQMEFGPYDLVGGSSTSPAIEPYQDVYCGGNLDLLTFTIDTLPDTEYTWILPPSYNELFMAEDSLAISITTYVPTDTLYVQASNGCGTSDSIPLPISVGAGPNLAVNGAPAICAGSEFMVGYSGSAIDIVAYLWDTPGGVISTGAADAQNIGVTYSMPGMYSYSLLVTDSGGCTSQESFDVEVEALLENPTVTCGGDQTEIVFTWEDIPGATSYNVIDINLPAGATGTLNGNTYTITGVSPNDQADIQVISEGSGCVEVPINSSCLASSCDLSAVQIVLFEDQEICLGDPDNMPVQFDISLPAGFSGLYTGRGVDLITGLFDPTSSELIPGENPVSFDFTDGGACSGMFEITITVNEPPVANVMATRSTFCLGESIQLSGVGQVATWDFGTDAIGDENNLSYSSTGTKTVMVSVLDANSCSAESMIVLTVNDTIEAPVIICMPGTNNVDFDWQDIVGVDDYEVSVSINSGAPIVTTQNNSDFSATGLAEGDVIDFIVTAVAANGCNTQVSTENCQARTCAVPIIELSSAQQIFCSNDITTNPVNVIIRVDGTAPPASDFTLIGDGIVASGNDNTFDPDGLIPGTYTVTFTYTNPSDFCQTVETLDFQIIEVPLPSIVLDNADICIDETVSVTLPPQPINVTDRDIDTGNATLTFLNPDEFTLDFDTPGVFDLMVTYEVADCPDPVATEQINVSDTIETPRIFCANVDTDFVEFGWQDQNLVTEYEIYIDNMFDSTITDPEFRIDGLTAGDSRTIRVVAIDPICGNKESEFDCMAQTCIEPTWVSNIPDVQCYSPDDGSITLDVEATSLVPNSMGTLSWLESDVSDSGEFTPEATTQEYNFTAIFTEGNCTSQFPVTFTINVESPPELELSGPDVICVGSSVNVSSTFSGTGNEVAMWNFNGGDESGSGFGPYDVTFDTPGTYQIELFIDNESCIGPVEMVQVIVEPELDAPVVNCNSDDINSVDLSWDAVDCASEYIIYVDGIEITTTSNLDFTVPDLVEDQEIRVTIEAVTSCACNNSSSAEIMCSSKPCDQTTWTISNNTLDEVCLDVNAQSYTISATPDDLPGLGTGTWSGLPIADGQSGLVDPSLVTTGTYDVVYDYEEGGCTYTSPVVQLTFVEEPTVSLVAVDPACEMDDLGTISAVGSGGASGYMFSIDGGALQSSGDFTDVGIGNHTIQIEDASGCINSATISILAPDVPSATISGPETVIIDNDAMYNLDLQNADNIENIIWTVNGVIVCEGVNCSSYSVTNAQEDFTIDVEVIYDGGCMVPAQQFAVNVKEVQAFYIPNTVAYNSVDGNNEWKIFIKGNETFPKSIKIYDRWGNLVHAEDFLLTSPVDQLVLWDGESNDRAISSGVYVYVLIIDVEDRQETIGGDVTIFR